MRFQVPQFIEVEDKIFGPFTLKQFVYLAGAVGIIIILVKFLPTFLAIMVAVPVIGVALGLAFFKVNSRPFIITLESMFKFLVGQKLYIWKKEEKQATPGSRGGVAPQISLPHLSNSKLKDLSWSLDVTKSSGVDAEKEKVVGEELR